MPRYLVNKITHYTGEHEIHTTFCPLSPSLDNSIYLGYFSSCRNAIKEARKHFVNVDGCVFCSEECNAELSHSNINDEVNFKKN